MDNWINDYRAVRDVAQALDASLLKPRYRARVEAGAHRMTGHCYVASEAVYHLLGGLDSGLTPRTVRINGDVHWWLTRDGWRDDDNKIIDVTIGQFATVPNYWDGTGRGFLTRQPSKRAQVVIDRVLQRRAAQAHQLAESKRCRTCGEMPNNHRPTSGKE